MPKRLEGFVDNGRGEPAADLPAVATRLSDGVVVDTTITDDDGHWFFPDLPVEHEYLVTLSDPQGNAVSRAPWSGEMRELWVRDRLDMTGNLTTTGGVSAAAWLETFGNIGVAGNGTIDGSLSIGGGALLIDQDGDIHQHAGSLAAFNGAVTVGSTLDVAGKPVALDPAAGNALAWTATGLYVPPAPAPLDAYTKAESDTRYLNASGGDTMSGDLIMVGNIYPPVPVVELGLSTKRWMKVWADAADFSAAPTVGGSPLLTAAAADALFLTPAEGDAAYVNIGGDTMTGLLTSEGAAAATIVHQARVALDAQPRFTIRADGRLDWGGGSVAVDIPLYRVTAGDFRIGSTFSGSTNNTRDLGFTTVQWKAIYGNQLFLSGDGTSAPAWANAGAIRLRNAATGDIAWRNAANSGNLTLGVTASDVLTSSAAIAAPSATLTTSLTVATKPVAISPDGSNIIEWRANGFYAAAGAVSDIWVNTAGDTMSGPLLIANGTISAPALAFANQTNSGLYLHGSGPMLVHGGVNRLIAHNSGVSISNGNLIIDNGDLTLTTGRLAINAANAGLEFGAVGTSNTPFFDFHSGAVGVDWDVRLIANGGTGVNSGGTLQILAATLAVSTNQTVGGTLGVTGATTLSTLQVNSRPIIMAGCHVYHNANQSIPNATETPLAFNSERFDSDAFHDTVTNNGRITVPAGMAGKYLVWALIEWALKSDSTNRVVRLSHSSRGTIALVTAANNNSTGYNFAQPVSIVVDLAAGDYITCAVRQDSGAALNVNYTAEYSPAFGMQRVG
jgi:hypothetical protein